MAHDSETDVTFVWGNEQVTLPEADALALRARFREGLAGPALYSRMKRTLGAEPGDRVVDLGEEETRATRVELRNEVRLCIEAEAADAGMTDGLRALAEMLDKPWARFP